MTKNHNELGFSEQRKDVKSTSLFLYFLWYFSCFVISFSSSHGYLGSVYRMQGYTLLQKTRIVEKGKTFSLPMEVFFRQRNIQFNNWSSKLTSWNNSNFCNSRTLKLRYSYNEFWRRNKPNLNKQKQSKILGESMCKVR